MIFQGGDACLPKTSKFGKGYFRRRPSTSPFKHHNIHGHRQTGRFSSNSQAALTQCVSHYFLIISLSAISTFPDVDCGPLSLSWQRSWHDEDKMNRSKGSDTIALSAFMLSALPTRQARKVLVKEMWESGAEVMVSILTNQNQFRCDINIDGDVLDSNYHA